jgi:hypothetical protein
VKYANDWEERLREPCYVIGHNTVFDLGALAIHCGLARKDLYGGLSLVMSGGEHDPNSETEEAFKARLEIWRTAKETAINNEEGEGEELPIGTRVAPNVFGGGTILTIETGKFGKVAQVKCDDGHIRKILMSALLKQPQSVVCLNIVSRSNNWASVSTSIDHRSK